MKFFLDQDKIVIGEKGTPVTFIEAGIYQIVRWFDRDRVMVQTNLERPRQVTLLRVTRGTIVFANDF